MLALSMIFSFCACTSSKKTTKEEGQKTSSLDNTTSNTSSSPNTTTDKTESEDESPKTTVSYVTSEVTVTKPSSNMPENPNKSWHVNPESLCFPISGDTDEMANDMRSEILNNKEQSIAIKGTTYYVSENGNDNNDGKTPQTAWASIARVEAHSNSLKFGDAVLFERDGIFRGQLKCISGVYYGAYGEGDKPYIYGTDQNYAEAGFIDLGNNIWRLKANFKRDVGTVVFNHGEAVAYRRNSRTELTENFDFYCDTNNNNRVYLYLDEDPNELFLSIEVCYDGCIFNLDDCKNVTIENLTFKYTGGHAIRGSNTENITVRYCEIGYIGGSYLNGYKEGNVRYGNGVELINSSKNSLIEKNWIYQIYDSGITHQGDNCVVENFTARNNLVEFCGMGAIEYWHTKEAVMKNILYADNLLRFTGYGFGGLQRPDKEMSAAIQSNARSSGARYNKSENFVIENNVFELGTYQLINIASEAGTNPVLKGNTYIQVGNRWLGYYGSLTNMRFNSTAENVIKEDWKDKGAVVASK